MYVQVTIFNDTLRKYNELIYNSNIFAKNGERIAGNQKDT